MAQDNQYLNNLYEYKSAIQKCIRRGEEVEAYYFASQLEEMDSRQLWARLKIISVEDIGPANPMVQLIVESCEKNYYDLLNRKYPNSGARLYLLQAITVMCRSQKSRDNDDLLCWIDSAIKMEKFKLEVPDYALDKHTRRGVRMGRGIEFFFDVGAKLNNEDPQSGKYADNAKKFFMEDKGGCAEWKMSRIRKGIVEDKKEESQKTGLDSFYET